MTSLELVDYINASRAPGEAILRHDSFMDKVPKVLGDDAPKFIGTQTYGNNNTRTIYVFPKREACLMAMSYSYELQAKVFDRMTALETQVSQQAPSLPNFANPAEAARAWAVQYERAEEQAQKATEKALSKSAKPAEYVAAMAKTGKFSPLRRTAWPLRWHLGTPQAGHPVRPVAGC